MGAVLPMGGSGKEANIVRYETHAGPNERGGRHGNYAEKSLCHVAPQLYIPRNVVPIEI